MVALQTTTMSTEKGVRERSKQEALEDFVHVEQESRGGHIPNLKGCRPSPDHKHRQCQRGGAPVVEPCGDRSLNGTPDRVDLDSVEDGPNMQEPRSRRRRNSRQPEQEFGCGQQDAVLCGLAIRAPPPMPPQLILHWRSGLRPRQGREENGRWAFGRRCERSCFDAGRAL
jgi:hypothetical protein